VKKTYLLYGLSVIEKLYGNFVVGCWQVLPLNNLTWFEP